MEVELAGMRVDYRRDELDVGDLASTWHEQLVRWLGRGDGSRRQFQFLEW